MPVDALNFVTVDGAEIIEFLLLVRSKHKFFFPWDYPAGAAHLPFSDHGSSTLGE